MRLPNVQLQTQVDERNRSACVGLLLGDLPLKLNDIGLHRQPIVLAFFAKEMIVSSLGVFQSIPILNVEDCSLNTQFQEAPMIPPEAQNHEVCHVACSKAIGSERDHPCCVQVQVKLTAENPYIRLMFTGLQESSTKQINGSITYFLHKAILQLLKSATLNW